MMNFINDIGMTVIGYLKADWYILLIGILLAVSINVYLDPDKFKKFLEKNSKMSIFGSITFGAFTPLCACGTMAVLLSMFITAMPWGPVMAFLISSPLTSPSEFMFQTAFFGTNFAIAVLISSLALGIFAGLLAHGLDKNTSFFKNQFRMVATSNVEVTINNTEIETAINCCDSNEKRNEVNDVIDIKFNKKVTFIKKYKINEFIKKFYELGIKKVLLYFVVFIAIGRVAEMVIPKEWIMSLLGGNKTFSTVLGATIGLPLYVSGSAALPLMKSFMNSGASQGVLLAFLITGKATGVPVIAGMATILKKRAILFYVLFVYFGGIVVGLLYQLILNMM